MRKSKAKERVLTPDPKFNDVTVARFVNMMMMAGKKSVSQNIFYTALELVGKKVTEEAGIETFKKALNNVMPAVEVPNAAILYNTVGILLTSVQADPFQVSVSVYVVLP